VRIDRENDGFIRKGAIVLLDDRPDWREDDLVLLMVPGQPPAFRTYRRSTLEHAVVSPVGSREEVKVERMARPRIARVKAILMS
jgi:hypothetical protein